MGARTIGLIVAAFLAGGALVYIAGPRAADPPADGPGVALPPRPLPESPTVDASSLDIRDVDPPEVPTGDGTIRGYVRTAEGAPVASAVVRACPVVEEEEGETRRRDLPPDSLPDLETHVREVVESWHWDRLTLRETITAEDGSFILTGLAPCPYWIRAWVPGHEVEPKEPRRREWRPGELAEFVATGAVVLTIDCSGAAETDMVRIRCWRGEEKVLRIWGSRRREITLPPGTWTLQARAGEGLVSDPVELTLVAGSPPPPLTLRLEGKPGLHGRVVGLVDQEGLWVQVKLLPVCPGDKADPRRLVDEGLDEFVARILEWKYAFEELAPGPYLIGVVLNREQLAMWERVAVGGSRIEKDLVVPPPDAEGSIVIRVLDDRGKPVEDPSFFVGFQGEMFYPDHPAHVARLPDGSWRVAVHTPEDEDADPAAGFVEVRSPTRGVVWAVFDPRAGAPIEVRLPPPAELVVTLEGYAGTPYAGDLDFLLHPHVGGESLRVEGTIASWSHKIDIEGRKRFGPLAPGRYELIVERGYDRIVARLDLDLPSGRTERTVRLPPLSTLTVRTEGVPEGEEVQLVPVDPRLRGTEDSAHVVEGTARFEGIPAGEYLLTYIDDERVGRARVTVGGDTTVGLRAGPINAARVVVRDADGIGARAGLRTGDLIVGIDGEEFAGARDLALRFATALTRDSARLLIIRGSRHMEIDIAFRHEDMGFSLEPHSR